ncbi:Ulp1 family isopeptidase [Mesorhizobium sophorae]|uniref:Ulp1 family isopeptidase n=1 Tax=Mesorhizobium sophorae TaxID=1300294 RepID=UPI001FD894B1|nr:Ulp1 family isopeptidase [Mesorhizobium sophorae]
MSKLGSGRTAKTVRNTASGQRKFSDWLRTMGRESIASRINGDWHQRESLDRDYQEFTKANGNVGIGFKRLAQYVQVVEANRALGVAFPDQPGREPQLAGASLSWSPRVPSDFDLNEWPTPEGPQAGRHETAVSSSTRSPRVPPDSEASMRPTPEGAPARSSEIYRGLHSFVDLPSTPQETRDDAQSAQVPGPAASPPFSIGPSGEPLELEDIGYLVGEDWQHGSQPVPDFLLDVLDNKMLLPSPRMVPRPVSINGETYSITLGPRGRRDAQFIHHPRPSSVPDAQIGASATSASSHDRGRVLGAREWLGDDHIQRDYEFVAQELRGTNPDLAARTRFVDPLIAFQLNHGADSDALRAFHRIVHDRNGNDTADCLFLLVNNASAIREGDHWSLLLVDRRNQERPVAYHYDSLRPLHHTIATELAERLGASSLQPMGMARQRNSFDCGVFVLDATRELARRLAQEPRPRRESLHLDNLVADRRALQERLMAQPPPRDQSAGP